MNRNISLVTVDPRNYRKIAQQNWGLTDEQMKGMHVHHRIPVSQGGSNDPSNLYVCSPSFHKWVWHNGKQFVDLATKGSTIGVETRRKLRETDEEWASNERLRCSHAAKMSHRHYAGTTEYSDKQRLKSLKTHASKRKHWTKDEYDFVWECHLRGFETGYQIAKSVGETNWKKYANMLKYASLGFSFEQLINVDKYIEEKTRLETSQISHLISCFQ